MEEFKMKARRRQEEIVLHYLGQIVGGITAEGQGALDYPGMAGIGAQLSRPLNLERHQSYRHYRQTGQRSAFVICSFEFFKCDQEEHRAKECPNAALKDNRAQDRRNVLALTSQPVAWIRNSQKKYLHDPQSASKS